MNEQNLNTQIQEGNTGQQLPYHTHNGVDSPVITVSESSLNLADITTGNATTSRHGLLPKLSGVATEFFDGTGDYDTVKDSDLSTSDITTNDVTTSKHGFVPKAPNDATKFFSGIATWAVPSISSVTITVTAGEELTAGEVVRLYVAGSDMLTKGHGQTTGVVYAARAAANDTTYGTAVIGIAYSNIDYLDTGLVTIIGSSTVTGLTDNTKYYLSNYTGTSSLIGANDQSQSDTELVIANATISCIAQQVFIPQSSRLDKVIFDVVTEGGGSALHVDLYRTNTKLAETDISTGAGATFTEMTWDLTDIQVWKGELLRFVFSNASGMGSRQTKLMYKSGGDVYAPLSQGSSAVLSILSGNNTVADGSDLWMKIYEYPDFGKLGTSAGTRKYKMGHAIDNDVFLVSIQEGDSIL